MEKPNLLPHAHARPIALALSLYNYMRARVSCSLARCDAVCQNGEYAAMLCCRSATLLMMTQGPYGVVQANVEY